MFRIIVSFAAALLTALVFMSAEAQQDSSAPQTPELQSQIPDQQDPQLNREQRERILEGIDRFLEGTISLEDYVDMEETKLCEHSSAFGGAKGIVIDGNCWAYVGDLLVITDCATDAYVLCY